MVPALAFAVAACRLLLVDCIRFAACSPLELGSHLDRPYPVADPWRSSPPLPGDAYYLVIRGAQVTPNVTQERKDDAVKRMATWDYSDKQTPPGATPVAAGRRPTGTWWSEVLGGRSRRDAHLVALSSVAGSSSGLRSGWSSSAMTPRWRGAESCMRSPQACAKSLVKG
jgi:hypothetical protein